MHTVIKANCCADYRIVHAVPNSPRYDRENTPCITTEIEGPHTHTHKESSHKFTVVKAMCLFVTREKASSAHALERRVRKGSCASIGTMWNVVGFELYQWGDHMYEKGVDRQRWQCIGKRCCQDGLLGEEAEDKIERRKKRENTRCVMLETTVIGRKH